MRAVSHDPSHRCSPSHASAWGAGAGEGIRTISASSAKSVVIRGASYLPDRPPAVGGTFRLGREDVTPSMKFAFVIHPTSLEDVVRYEPGAVGKGQPIIEKILDWMPAYAAAHITGVRTPDGRETEGWFVAATFMPEQMLTLPREHVYAK